MTREQLIFRLRCRFKATTENKLLDILQDRGLVSDEAVEIKDCADRDLIAALQSSQDATFGL